MTEARACCSTRLTQEDWLVNVTIPWKDTSRLSKRSDEEVGSGYLALSGLIHL